MTPTPPTPIARFTAAEQRDPIELIEEFDYRIFKCRTGFDGNCPHEAELTAAGLNAVLLCLEGLCHVDAPICSATAAELADPGSVSLAC